MFPDFKWSDFRSPLYFPTTRTVNGTRKVGNAKNKNVYKTGCDQFQGLVSKKFGSAFYKHIYCYETIGWSNNMTWRAVKRRLTLFYVMSLVYLYHQLLIEIQRENI